MLMELFITILSFVDLLLAQRVTHMYVVGYSSWKHQCPCSTEKIYLRYFYASVRFRITRTSWRNVSSLLIVEPAAKYFTCIHLTYSPCNSMQIHVTPCKKKFFTTHWISQCYNTSKCCCYNLFFASSFLF